MMFSSPPRKSEETCTPHDSASKAKPTSCHRYIMPTSTPPMKHRITSPGKPRRPPQPSLLPPPKEEQKQPEPNVEPDSPPAEGGRPGFGRKAASSLRRFKRSIKEFGRSISRQAREISRGSVSKKNEQNNTDTAQVGINADEQSQQQQQSNSNQQEMIRETEKRKDSARVEKGPQDAEKAYSRAKYQFKMKEKEYREKQLSCTTNAAQIQNLKDRDNLVTSPGFKDQQNEKKELSSSTGTLNIKKIQIDKKDEDKFIQSRQQSFKIVTKRKENNKQPVTQQRKSTFMNRSGQRKGQADSPVPSKGPQQNKQLPYPNGKQPMQKVDSITKRIHHLEEMNSLLIKTQNDYFNQQLKELPPDEQANEFQKQQKLIIKGFQKQFRKLYTRINQLEDEIKVYQQREKKNIENPSVTLQSQEIQLKNRDYYLELNQTRARYFERMMKDLLRETQPSNNNCGLKPEIRQDLKNKLAQVEKIAPKDKDKQKLFVQEYLDQKEKLIALSRENNSMKNQLREVEKMINFMESAGKGVMGANQGIKVLQSSGKDGNADIEDILPRMSSLSRELKYLRENDEVLRARIDSLISVNDKLTKSIRRKAKISKQRQQRTIEKESGELHEITHEDVHDDTQLSLSDSNLQEVLKPSEIALQIQEKLKQECGIYQDENDQKDANQQGDKIPLDKLNQMQTNEWQVVLAQTNSIMVDTTENKCFNDWLQQCLGDNSDDIVISDSNLSNLQSIISTSTAAKQNNQQEKKFDNQLDLQPLLPQCRNITSTYTIGQTVGSGSYSVVKMAKNKQTGEHVAIKIIDKTTLDRKQVLAVIAEADILKKLNHQNILSFKDFFILKDHLCIVTDLLGMNCLCYVKDYFMNMSEKERKFIFYQITRALAHCHKNGVMHRDLKLDNILVNVDEKNQRNIKQIKLADFGMACSINNVQYEQVCGTLGYMAPEILTGKLKYTEKVDIWSMGVILYNLITGRMPFMGTQAKVFEQTLRKEPKYKMSIWKKFSPDALDLAQQLFQKDPGLRPDAEQILNHPWLEDIHLEHRVNKQ